MPIEYSSTEGVTKRSSVLCRGVPPLVESRHEHAVCAQFRQPFEHIFRIPRDLNHVPEKRHGNEDCVDSTFAVITDLILNDSCGTAPRPGRSKNDHGTSLPREILILPSSIRARGTDPLLDGSHFCSFRHFNEASLFRKPFRSNWKTDMP